MITWFSSLISGILTGFLLGFIWNIHKIGKYILVGILLLGGILIIFLPGGETSFINSFDPIRYELFNFLGIMIGSALSRGVLEMLRE